MRLKLNKTLIMDTPIEVLMTLFTNPKIGIIRVSSRWTKTKKPSVDHTKIVSPYLGLDVIVTSNVSSIFVA